MSSSSTTPEAGQHPEPTPSPLSPERLAEYAALVQAATEGPWEADAWEINSPTGWVGETCDIDDDKKSRANAAFIAAARTAVPELLAEVERLTAELAKYVGHEPTLTEEALYAHGEKVRAEAVEKMQRPSRLFATPAEVDVFLRRHFAEDVVLNFQQAIGGGAVGQATRDLYEHRRATAIDSDWSAAADHIDPAKSGGPYPSKLLCSQHNGFGECPGAPWCTPRQDATTEAGAR